jgi:hypothetical protein
MIVGANLCWPIAESLQLALNLKTTAAGSALHFPSQFYPSMPEIQHATAKRTRRCARICRATLKSFGEIFSQTLSSVEILRYATRGAK